jgi:hypothetical protein
MLEMATKLERPARRPRVALPHVGEHIREDILPDLGLSVSEAAKRSAFPARRSTACAPASARCRPSSP